MAESIIVAGGCFWCLDSAYRNISGILNVTSGYIGGNTKNPDYNAVCSGQTGHAEAIKIEFDEKLISFEKILFYFFKLHNPTTLNRQGADVGTQYRSAIFYNNDNIKNTAEKIIQNLTKNAIFNDPIVTSIEKAETFYPAEDYHQNYFAKNPENAYCQAVIAPKLKQFFDQYT